MSETALSAFRKRGLDRWRQRFVDYLVTKRGPLTPPLELNYRQIFILPTRFGFGFGMLLIIMALGALNFNNNLGLILTYLLAAIAQLSMHFAYRNLSGLGVTAITTEPVFAGESAEFRIWLQAGEHRERPVIQAIQKPQLDCVDVPDSGHATLTIKKPTSMRGWLELGDFKLESRYPIGLFRAWSWIRSGGRCLVWPAPHASPPPLPRGGVGKSEQVRIDDGEELHSLRDYQAGDAMNRIAWRATARHQHIYAKVMATPGQQAITLNWDTMPGRPIEERLAVLCAWVLKADQHQLSYSLSIPGAEIKSDSGPAHRVRCLNALALFS